MYRNTLSSSTYGLTQGSGQSQSQSSEVGSYQGTTRFFVRIFKLCVPDLTTNNTPGISKECGFSPSEEFQLYLSYATVISHFSLSGGTNEPQVFFVPRQLTKNGSRILRKPIYTYTDDLAFRRLVFLTSYQHCPRSLRTEKSVLLDYRTKMATSKFQDAVYDVCVKIPKGKVSTYGHLAKAIASHPRAVGGALRRNPHGKHS